MLQNITRRFLLPHNVNSTQRATATATKIAAKTHNTRRPKAKAAGAAAKPLISCKRQEFNLYVPEAADTKFGKIPLASAGWLHNKSKGDYFTINASANEEDELQAELQDLNEFQRTAGTAFTSQLLQNLRNELEIERLTRIQVLGMPKIYDNNHVLIAAETGCGKTLTYLLPIVQQLLERKQRTSSASPSVDRRLNTPLAVIITPGRELATQIGDVAAQLCTETGLQVATVLGGNTKQLMVNPSFEDVDILVATIGALSKLVTTGIYRMHHVRHVVLDEADTLLDDSFGDKLSHFLKRFPFHKNHTQDDRTVGTQLVLASATMPTNTVEMLQRVIDVETLHQVVSDNLHKLMPHVEQKFLRMSKADRPANLLGLVKTELAKQRPLIIFSNKSAASDYISIFLNDSGVNCLNLNGDMLMKIRIGRFEQFQHGECDVLSTTDVSSRGLDTTRARHVINFDFPLHVSDYIHRCGRIGRVGNRRKCLVTNFISSGREIDVVQRIEHTARIGGLLPNVNANIRSIINKRIINELQLAEQLQDEQNNVAF